MQIIIGIIKNIYIAPIQGKLFEGVICSIYVAACSFYVATCSLSDDLKPV